MFGLVDDESNTRLYAFAICAGVLILLIVIYILVRLCADYRRQRKRAKDIELQSRRHDDAWSADTTELLAPKDQTERQTAEQSSGRRR